MPTDQNYLAVSQLVPSATEALKLIQARTTLIGICQTTSAGEFLS
jgi:hypothetical protein